MIGADAQRQRAAHAEADDDEVRDSLRETLIGGLGLAGPVGPTSRQHVVDRRAVARQQRHLDVEAGGGQRLGDTAHRRRVAGEAVEHEGTVVGVADVRPGLGTGKDRRGHASIMAAQVRRQTYGSSEPSGSSHQSPGTPAVAHSGNG